MQTSETQTHHRTQEVRPPCAPQRGIPYAFTWYDQSCTPPSLMAIAAKSRMPPTDAFRVPAQFPFVMPPKTIEPSMAVAAPAHWSSRSVPPCIQSHSILRRAGTFSAVTDAVCRGIQPCFPHPSARLLVQRLRAVLKLPRFRHSIHDALVSTNKFTTHSRIAAREVCR